MNIFQTIPKKIITFLKQLEEDGHEAYIVGGAVRDMLMGIEPKDWDIATSAVPGQIMATFRYLTGSVKQINASFPVVEVAGIEIATYRKDVYRNGITISTVAISELEDDLARRDLTINAMAMNRHGNIIDPFGGQEDLKNRIIRFVGDAEERIYEDPCRIIRACRFLTLIDGKFIADTQAALIHKSYIIKNVPPERIRLEILKAMKYKNASKFFIALHRIGILENIFPALAATYRADHGQYHKEDIFTHMMLAGDFVGEHFPEQSAMFRLTAYLHDVGKSKPNWKDGELHFYDHEIKGADILKEELKALKFTTAEIKYASNLVLVHMRGGVKMSPKTTRKMMKRFTELDVDWREWLALKVADRAANTSREPYSKGRVKNLTDKFLHEINPEPTEQGMKPCFEHKNLAMSGTQIQRMLGIGPSQLVGVILDWLLNQVIGDPSLNTNEKLTALIKGRKAGIKKKD